MSAHQFTSLLEKMKNSDKDIRFMATNDMLAQLGKDSFKLDDKSEENLVTAVLKILHDNSSEVQNLGVKCIAKLLQRSLAQNRPKHADKIAENLCADLISPGREERHRDIASLALKSCVTVLGPQVCLFCQMGYIYTKYWTVK